MRRLAVDYAFQFDRVAPSFAGNPADPAAWSAAIREAQQHDRPRAAIAAMIRAQQERRGSPPEAITAALRNLIENAVRMTPPGQEVCVICGPGPRVSVTDGGPGVPPETLPDLCSRFRRAENASEAGAGLGLSIVARVLELHHGRIESAPDIPALSLVFPPADKPDR